jgi:hypothetical protein
MAAAANDNTQKLHCQTEIAEFKAEVRRSNTPATAHGELHGTPMCADRQLQLSSSRDLCRVSLASV